MEKITTRIIPIEIVIESKFIVNIILAINGGHGGWRSFSGMYMFQFIGHIQQEPENHHDNDCIRCTGVFLGKNIIFNGVHGRNRKYMKTLIIMIHKVF